MKLFNKFVILKKNLIDIDYLDKEKVDFWKQRRSIVYNSKALLSLLWLIEKYFESNFTFISDRRYLNIYVVY